ncbi:MAG: EF2563 family selenium-dependent molybdenum hydroxylase system protein [Chloroflexi bacterium]|nr:EF2563 family selenium-dependent molybdenum hydroxylase system protein [Chloroflexota bacterium]NOG62143.1 EF2563 family selenium-dependent molybdenum hydroxylase system protein [Chloroflexota bacterium]
MDSVPSSDPLPIVLIRGAGDLGSGVAFRLYHAGYPVIMVDLPTPLLVRRTVSFGSAIFEPGGVYHVEGITSRVIKADSAVWLAMRGGEIPIVVDTDGAWRNINTQVVIDARVAKRNIDTTPDDAEFVLALGPGFTVGTDCHAIVETQRGHNLGRVIWQGSAIPNTGIPGTIGGKDSQRVLRAPRAGHVKPNAAIGDSIEEGAIIATVDGEPIVAPFSGMLRGLIHESVEVWAGLKVGDLDPRGVREHCFTISDKALAIGGGVLEAILSRGILPLHKQNRVRDEADAFT